MKFTHFLSILFVSTCFLSQCSIQEETNPTSFSSNWQERPELERHFAGQEFWLNPLQAWQQKDGKLSTVSSGGDRNCVLLIKSIDKTKGILKAQVNVEVLSKDSLPSWIGFQLGLKGEFGDYRDDALHGRGLCVGINQQSQLFIGSPDSSTTMEQKNIEKGVFSVNIEVVDSTVASIKLKYQFDSGASRELTKSVHPSYIQGLMALTASTSFPSSIDLQAERPSFSEMPNLGKRKVGSALFSFNNWVIEGDLLEDHPERAYGPILWCQYTVSGKVLKMSTQFVPLGNDLRVAELWVNDELVQEAKIDEEGNNAIFRIENWMDNQSHSYQIRYRNGGDNQFTYEGTIQANAQSESLKVASLSCVDDVGFPHQDLVNNVLDHQADLFVFHGDQLYERVGGYGVERKSKLDYLRKWYVFGWSFGVLLKDRPSVIIPDDHDVFHGNLWGAGGKLANVELGYGYASQDDGGYKERPDFVNMVHRTQTGHLPDPVDPDPVLNDISVYFTELKYRGVSFAILGDRQWKSAPKAFFPNAAIENGWPQNTNWNPKTEAFHPEAELLGPRQENFLEQWVENWGSDIYLKALISQSPFCNVATLPADIWHDKYVPGLPKYKLDEYPEDDRPVADFDSNGWPQNKRDKAIKTIRKAFALHFTGDQHLGSTGRYGVDEYDDGGYWISSPAVSNLWPRRWYPAQSGADGPIPDKARYMGKYEDGFGNKISVQAIANPHDIDREPARIFDKAPGYSIIEFNTAERSMNLAVWPRWASPNNPDASRAFPDWPIKIQQEDNYGKARIKYLDAVELDGKTLVKVYEEETGELLYALKPQKGSFTPFVFSEKGTYRVTLEAEE